ncbi:hypothetical protein N9C56_09890 [Paracoccaceae bacterium]|nr:hypothetical protein [Paracoccaceae bacterium]
MPIELGNAVVEVVEQSNTILKVVEQDNTVVDVVTAAPQGISAYAVWLAEGNTGTEADFFASMVGESGSAASISHDPENQLTTGSDGGIFAPTFKYKTTDW